MQFTCLELYVLQIHNVVYTETSGIFDYVLFRNTY